MSMKCHLSIAWGLIGLLIFGDQDVDCGLIKGIDEHLTAMSLVHMVFHVYSCVKYLVLFIAADYVKDKRQRNCVITVMQGYFVTICVCCYMKISLHELSWQDNSCIKCALSTLRAHFCVISFTKSDLSIIATSFNAIEGSLRDQGYQAYFAYMKVGPKLTWIWLTLSAVMISTPERLFKVIIKCCIDQRPKKKTTCICLYGVQCPPKFNFRIFLVFLAFDVVVSQFVPTSAIEHSSFQFIYSNCRFDIVCFTIQLCSLEDSTFKFTLFNIQVYAIQHSTFEDACFRYMISWFKGGET